MAAWRVRQHDVFRWMTVNANRKCSRPNIRRRWSRPIFSSRAVEIGLAAATSVRHASRGGTERRDEMRYMMMIYADEKQMTRQPAEGVTRMSAAYVSYTKALKEAGVWLGGDALKPTPTATSVRLAGGKTSVLDGPFAETREQLGGYYLIDVADLDAAIGWAARCPGAANGTVELRPVWEMTS
jgi:hypothetical protein